MKMSVRLLAAVAVVGLLATTSFAAILEDFETGYTDGAILGGQGSWLPNTGYAAGYANVMTTQDLGSNWAAGASLGGNQGAQIAHGEAYGIGSITVSADIFVGDEAAYEEGYLGFVDSTGDYVITIQLWPDSFRIIARDPAHPSGGARVAKAITPAWGDWYNMSLTYDATSTEMSASLYEYSTSSVLATITAADSAAAYLNNYFTTIPTFDNVLVAGYAASGATLLFDNVTVVPEPGTMALLGLGGIAALLSRRRR